MIVKLCQADVPTRNRRIYPRKVLEAQIERLRESAKSRGLLGEITAPESSVVRVSNTSHLVTDLFMAGDNFMAEVEILLTPAGKVLTELMDNKVSIGFKMAGIGGGNVNDDGNLVLNDSYKLIQVFADCDPASFHYPEPDVIVG